MFRVLGLLLVFKGQRQFETLAMFQALLTTVRVTTPAILAMPYRRQTIVLLLELALGRQVTRADWPRHYTTLAGLSLQTRC